VEGNKMREISVRINNKEITFATEKEGLIEVLRLPIKIEVDKESFLHIGAAPSPLSEKKGAVFKVDRTPVIPATSFKGALRYQLELLFINEFINKNKNENEIKQFTKIFKISENEDVLKPCIPTQNPTKSEEELKKNKIYRDKFKIGNKEFKSCQIIIDNNNVLVPEIGICPVCYFMGASGIMGFLRINNFLPYPEDENEYKLIDQTNIRIDRKTQTAAHGAKVETEHVKPGTVFKGYIDIIIHDPIKGFQFGYLREIDGKVIDKWLEKWDIENENERIKVLLEEILIPAIRNIKQLGGYKSRGAGKVNVDIDIAKEDKNYQKRES